MYVKVNEYEVPNVATNMLMHGHFIDVANVITVKFSRDNIFNKCKNCFLEIKSLSIITVGTTCQSSKLNNTNLS